MLALFLRFWPYLAAAAGLAFGTWWVYDSGHDAGVAKVRAEWAAERAQLEEQHDAEVARLSAAARYMDVRFIEGDRQIEERTRTIVKEVPRYVTVEADRACPIPAGFVRLHDAAAAGEDGVPADPPAGSSDAAASGVALSTVAATVVDNYGTCQRNAEQLIALQQYLREVANR